MLWALPRKQVSHTGTSTLEHDDTYGVIFSSCMLDFAFSIYLPSHKGKCARLRKEKTRTTGVRADRSHVTVTSDSLTMEAVRFSGGPGTARRNKHWQPQPGLRKHNHVHSTES